MSKIVILIAAGAGYVLGARAGRERYDAIEKQARRLWSDPRVQEKADQAQQVAKDVGSDVKDKAAEAAASAASSVSSAASSVTSSATPDGDQHEPTPADMPATTSETELGRGSEGV